jgi:PadR family transcriptional regulator PadR
MGRKAQKNDSLPGSLDMLILRTLSRRDLHGYGIVQFIQQSSDNELLVEEGSLYPRSPAAGAKRLDRRCLGRDVE